MHLADGIVSSPVLLAGLNLLGGTAVALAARRSRVGDPRALAWTGTLGAFALAIQALNVPLVPGASAHAIGAGLLTLALGPARAIVALCSVLVVQAVLLADGGITALGLNALDLAVLPALCVHGCRRLLAARFGLAIAAAIGTTLGALAGALGLALALIVGAGAPLGLTLGWLVGVQAVAGAVEGVLTAIAVRHLAGRAPALLECDGARPASKIGLLRWAAISIAIVAVLIPLASSEPDALTSVIAQLGAGP